jgi:hypothetical protein
VKVGAGNGVHVGVQVGVLTGEHALSLAFVPATNVLFRPWLDTATRLEPRFFGAGRTARILPNRSARKLIERPAAVAPKPCSLGPTWKRTGSSAAKPVAVSRRVVAPLQAILTLVGGTVSVAWLARPLVIPLALTRAVAPALPAG